MILKFDDELHGKKRFEFCFAGLIYGGSMQEKKGIQILRTEVGIYEKLESISEVKPCGKKLSTGEPDRQLKMNGPKEIQISSVEYDMLYNYLSIVPWQAGTPAKLALDTLDWMQATHNGRHS